MSGRIGDDTWRALAIDRALGETAADAPSTPARGRGADDLGDAGPEEYELAAAAVYLAFESGRGTLPGRLRRRLEARAVDHLNSPSQVPPSQ